MLISKMRTGPLWGVGGFILGVALSATAVGVLGLSASPSIKKSETSALREVFFPVPQSIILPVVKIEEIDAAIKDFPIKNQLQVREDVANGKYRLLWLTVWDWDTAEGEPGNTISILSDTHRQIITLKSHRTRFAIHEPKSGYIGMRGEDTEDGNIAISVLSGTQPIALPRMSPGQATRIKIKAQSVGAGPSSINIPANIPSLPD